jgi:hypothetical protein
MNLCMMYIFMCSELLNIFIVCSYSGWQNSSIQEQALGWMPGVHSLTGKKFFSSV